MIRVLVVEDSPTVSLLIKSILNSDPDIMVIDCAKNGEEGVAKTLSLNPDLITMDIHMPGIDGFEATRRIMALKPKPIIVVTSSMNHKEVNLSFKALEAGALAIVEKPSGPGNPRFDFIVNELIRVVKLMNEVKVVGRRINTRPLQGPIPVHKANQVPEIIGIAASTGGPAALATILCNFPSKITLPILIVQHISTGFDEGLAEWLSTVSVHNVSLAKNGQPIVDGQIYIAPQGSHMGVNKNKQIILDAHTGNIGSFRPSATYLFNSIAHSYGSNAIGVVLTGMGNDGSTGLISLHAAGGYVIAQDEASCVVYGMPGSAVAAGIVDLILPLDHIAITLTNLMNGGKP